MNQDVVVGIVIGGVWTLLVAAMAYLLGARQNAVLIVEALNATIRILNSHTAGHIELRRFSGKPRANFYRLNEEKSHLSATTMLLVVPDPDDKTTTVEPQDEKQTPRGN